MTPYFRLVPLAAMVAVLALAGCKNSETAGNAPVVNSVPEGDEETDAPEAPALPKVDLWKPLAGLVAGDYSSTCLHVTGGPERKPASASMAADGKFKFNEFAGDLRDGGGVGIHRSMEAGGKVRVMFSASSGDTMFSVVTDEKGPGRVLSFGKGEGNVFICDATKEPMALATRPLHLVYADVLEKASQKIACILPGEITRTASELKIKDGELSIGKYTYQLASMNEIVKIDANMAELSYTIIKEGGDSVAMGLNEFGKVITVIRQGQNNDMMMCTDEN